MITYVDLCCTPIEEPCIQMMSGTNYQDAMRKECNVFKRQLERQFPVPEGVVGYFGVRSTPYDDGVYYDVVAYYDDADAASEEWAYTVEEKLPKVWDDIAKDQVLNDSSIQQWYRDQGLRLS